MSAYIIPQGRQQNESKKKRDPFLSIVDYEKEQEYLRNMHKNGWKFINVSGLSYSFEKCEPEDVVYQLDFNKDGLEHKDEYIQMFKDYGWEYIQEFAGYTYFRKPAKEGIDESIFCDNQSRLELMNRIFEGRMVLMLNIFFLCLVPMFITMDKDNHALRIVYIVIMAAYVYVFIVFSIKYYRFKKEHS